MGQVINITSRSRIIARPERAEQPEDVKKSMDDWRLAGCWADVPANYQAWQRDLASEELDRIVVAYGLEVVNDPRVVNQGWFDGMGVVRVDVLTRSQRRVTLEWHDGNQGFMKVFGSGGATALFENDLS